MRIVKRQELMGMPNGTLFSHVYMREGYAEWVDGGLEVFGGALYEADGRAYDFASRSVDTHQSVDSGDHWQRHDDLIRGASYPVNADYGREGEFDDEARYLVYEQADIECILTDVLKAYPGADVVANGRRFAQGQDESDG